MAQRSDDPTAYGAKTTLSSARTSAIHQAVQRDAKRPGLGGEGQVGAAVAGAHLGRHERGAAHAAADLLACR